MPARVRDTKEEREPEKKFDAHPKRLTKTTRYQREDIIIQIKGNSEQNKCI